MKRQKGNPNTYKHSMSITCEAIAFWRQHSWLKALFLSECCILEWCHRHPEPDSPEARRRLRRRKSSWSVALPVGSFCFSRFHSFARGEKRPWMEWSKSKSPSAEWSNLLWKLTPKHSALVRDGGEGWTDRKNACLLDARILREPCSDKMTYEKNFR